MNAEAILERGLRKLAVPVPERAPFILLAYLALLEKWNHTINLTAIRERDRMVSQHLLDSLSVLPHLLASERRIADIGTGAGLPGIPLAIARPELRVTLVEPNQKKVAFLRQAKLELGLANLDIQGRRVEDLKEGSFDVVISRAFADLPDFVRVTERLLASDGRLIAMKGIVPYEEMSKLPAHAKAEFLAVDVPELSATRHLIVVRFDQAAQDATPPRGPQAAAGN